MASSPALILFQAHMKGSVCTSADTKEHHLEGLASRVQARCQGCSTECLAEGSFLGSRATGESSVDFTRRLLAVRPIKE